jgi:hypothetical protein
MLPVETWIASAPASSTHLQIWIESSSVLPRLSQKITALLWSTALILTWRWKSWPTSRRISRTISSRKRARFSSEPPNSSSRSLIAELRNCVIR